MKNKVAIFSSKGIGDGMFALQLAHQWILEGWEAVVFHPIIFELSPLFPHVQIEKDPEFSEKKAQEMFVDFDEILFIYENSSRQIPWREFALLHFLGKTRVINPIASHRKDVPFWDHARFDGRKSFSYNLRQFCKSSLSFPKTSFSQGLVLSPKTFEKREKLRIAIHPFSSKEGKNWRIESYLKLAKKLEKKGAEIVWIGTKEEKARAGLSSSPLFSNLLDLVEYLREIDLFVGNDSGIGHLCSCLGIPTVTICRSKRIIQFWQPTWSDAYFVVPTPYVLNFKPFRFRDNYWKSLITVRRALGVILPLLKQLNSREFGVFDHQSSLCPIDKAHLESCTQG